MNQATIRPVLPILSVRTGDDPARVDAWYEEAVHTGGVMLIDKESSWTSFDVVAKLRSAWKIPKIGHAGTLDPLATGLLIVCCGKGTKRITEFQDREKEYRAVVKLGATTRTYDAEGEEEDIKDVSHLDPHRIIDAASRFIGSLEQLPPMYSARKVDGKRLYQLARNGQDVDRPTTRVHIHALEITDVQLPRFTMTVRCSKGTYIRTLAHDIGAALGTGAYLESLRRTAIGEFSVDDALTVPALVHMARESRDRRAAAARAEETTENKDNNGLQ